MCNYEPHLSTHAGSNGTAGGGISYVRWGNSSCPSVPETSYVYGGIVASSHHRDSNGGGANHLCMPSEPDYITSTPRTSNVVKALLYGTAYQDPLVTASSDRTVPCAVCLAGTRTTVLMIPAKISCPTGWTLEYFGYIMTERTSDLHRRSIYECVDVGLEAIPGTNGAGEAGLLGHTVASCGRLDCSDSEYIENVEITCAVCTI